MSAPIVLEEPPLVGREPLLAQLRSALESAARGDGRTIFLSGESGIGKTRIIAALRAVAAEHGFQIAAGSANPVEQGMPYALVADALGATIDALDSASLATATRGHADLLSTIFPLVPVPRSSAPDAGGDPAEMKSRAFWACAQLLRKLSAQKPMLIVAENLQWADSASLELLHFLARQLGAGRVMLVATWTTGDGTAGPELLKLQRSAAALGFATSIRVEGVSVDATAELVSRMFATHPAHTREFAAFLAGWTRGNPLFMREVLRSLVETGALHRHDGRWEGWDVRAITLPSTVHELLSARMSELSDHARTVMVAMAVAGTNVRHALLQRVAGIGDEALLSACDELRRHGIVVDLDEPAGARYEFAHPLLRDVALVEGGIVRRKQLHARIARALEALHHADVDDHAETIAFHLLHADDPDANRDAAAYLVAAGERALERRADTEAVTYLRTALELTPAMDRDSCDRASLLLARALQRTGAYDEAIRLWAAIVERARARGDGDAMADAALRLGLARFWSGDREGSLSAYDDALNATADATRHARVHIARAASLQEMARTDEAHAELALALQVASSSGDVALQARAERGLLLLHAWTGPAREARERGSRAIALATEAGNRPLLWSAHWAMALLAGLTGDAPGVAEHLAQCERIASEIASPVLEVWTAEVSVEYASGVGDWDAGLETAARVIPLARTLGQRALLARLLVWTAIIRMGRGEMDVARDALDEAWRTSGADDETRALRNPHAAIPAHTGRAAWHLARGEFADAVRVADAGLALADRAGYIVWAVHRLLPIMGEASLWLGDFERAARLSRRMRSDARRLDHRLGLAWADACDALLVLFRDRDPARAVPLLRAAAAALEAIPFPEYAARVRRQLGSALWDLGDRDGACRELRLAHTMLARMGASRELDAIRAQLREYGARPPHRATPSQEKLTGREMEIARLVAAHRTNTQIGAELGISARTVSTHLSHIFAKLGVASRGELADAVRGIARAAAPMSLQP